MSIFKPDFENNMDRVFDDFIKDLNVARRGNAHSGRVKVPAMDVHENENEILINAELPVCI